MKTGVYIHVPFCKNKCNYCDFYSVTNGDTKKYLTALKTEIKLIKERYNFSARSIYLGGGTPTILKLKELEELLKIIGQEIPVTDNFEFSIEANPASLNQAKLKLLKEAGINRISLGVQSFNNQRLSFLGRQHNKDDIITNYSLARKNGFENISFDLIFAIPKQSLADWEQDLEMATKLAPEHISAYNLKIETGTEFYRQLKSGEINKISEELDLKMYQKAIDKLADNGYQRYEISNFAQDGFDSKHNKTYWNSKPYLAFGPGAHFFDGQARGYNFASLERYCQQLVEENEFAWQEYNLLSKKELIEEYLLMGLRLTEGISITDFNNRFNSSFSDIYASEIEELIERNLVFFEADRLKLTERGLLLTNQVLAYFLLD